MTLQTGTSGNDDFYDNSVSAGNSYDGGGGDDTLHLQVATDAIERAGESDSAYSFYTWTFNGQSYAPASTLTSIERIEFDSTPGTMVSATLDIDNLSTFGLTELIGGAGTDNVSFLVSGSEGTMPSNLKLTNWSLVPKDAWDANGADTLELFSATDQVGSPLTLNAAKGLNVLQVLVGGATNDTLNGSDNADILVANESSSQGFSSTGLDVIHGNGGNDSIVIDNEYLYYANTLWTNSQSIYDGGAGTDVLTIAGQVMMQSTLISIEGVNLLLPVTPQTTGSTPVFGRTVADPTLDSAHAAMLPSNAFFIGGGTITINVTNGTGFDGSGYVVTPSQDAIAAGVPITFDINGEDGDGLKYVGTAAADTITFGAGTQTATGGAGADIFKPGQGNDTVTDFVPGVDKVDLSDSGLTDLQQVMSVAMQVGGNVVANYEGTTLTLEGVALGSLTAHDFIFAPVVKHTPTDFDNNGISDILFDSPSRGVATWELASGQPGFDVGIFGDPGSDFHVVATGNFGRWGDVLFQDGDGTIASWYVFGPWILGGGTLGNPGPDYALLGTADFNNDGTSELLFLNGATGDYTTWNVSDQGISEGTTIGSPGANWVYKAAADFNGDGDADLLFQGADGSYAIWELINGKLVGGGAIGNPGAGWFFKATGDFNGDGKADILFENANGSYAIWDLDGTHVIGGGTLGNPGAGFTLAAIGDYNGDGYSDLLFRKADGTLATWDLHDTKIIGGSTIGNPGSDFSVVGGEQPDTFATLVFQDTTTNGLSSVLVGSDSVVSSGALGTAGGTALATGDFSATGEVDVLWRDGAGSFSYTTVDGTNAVGTTTIGNPGANYSFVAVGDFNGDGKSDILFQNKTDGTYATWDVSGGHVVGGGTLGAAAGYTVVATGDFNGDGKSDILFRNTSTGAYADWLMSDTTVIGGGAIGNPGAGWQFKGTGDFNGDGKSDMLFENASGNYAIWDLNGTAIVGGGSIGNPGANWQLAKIVDLNQDGRDDLLFVDGTGHYASWLMSDTTIIAGNASLGTVIAGQHLI